MNEMTAFEAAMPALVVGQSFADGAPPLGLGEPIALLGGDSLGPGGIPFQVMHEHQPGFLQWVRENCQTCLAAERPWFRGQPTLLVGAKGAGRTHAARWLARIVGVPFVILNLTDPVIAANLSASGRVSEALWASPITIAMAAARCANPIVLVVGVEEASGDAVSGLVSMIDPEAGAGWREDQLRTMVDLGEVTWLIQCEQASRVPASLRTLTTQVSFDRSPMGFDTVFTLSVLLEAMGDLGIEPTDPIYAWDRVSERLPGGLHAAKGVYAAVSDALAALRREAIGTGDAEPY